MIFLVVLQQNDLTGPDTRKDFGRGAGHEDGTVVAGPFEFQVAAREMSQDLAIGLAGQNSRHGNGTGPRSTSKGDAAATLPRPHDDFRWRNSLHKVHVDPSRKEGRVLQNRTDRFQRNLRDVRTINDGVRIAHRNARHLQFDFALLHPSCIRTDEITGNRKIDHLVTSERCRDVRRCEDRRSHVDADFGNFAILAGEHLQREDAATRFNFEFRFLSDAVVVNILGDTADAVAAHFRFAAISVEHSHARVGSFGGTDEDQAVPSHAKVPIADGNRSLGDIARNRLGKAINVNVIIAQTVHFGKTHKNSLQIALRERSNIDYTHPRSRVEARQSGSGLSQLKGTRRITEEDSA